MCIYLPKSLVHTAISTSSSVQGLHVTKMENMKYFNIRNTIHFPSSLAFVSSCDLFHTFMGTYDIEERYQGSVWMRRTGERGDVITELPLDPVSYKMSRQTGLDRLSSVSLGGFSSLPLTVSPPNEIALLILVVYRKFPFVCVCVCAGGEVCFWLTSARRLADPCAWPWLGLLIGLLVFISLAETRECGSEEVGEEHVGEMKKQGWHSNMAFCHLHFMSGWVWLKWYHWDKFQILNWILKYWTENQDFVWILLLSEQLII